MVCMKESEIAKTGVGCIMWSFLLVLCLWAGFAHKQESQHVLGQRRKVQGECETKKFSQFPSRNWKRSGPWSGLDIKETFLWPRRE